MQLVAILGVPPDLLGPASAIVHVLDIDPELLGKTMQLGDSVLVDVPDQIVTRDAVQAAYPTAIVYNSADEMSTAVQQLLINAGLRVRSADDDVMLSAAAQSIDAGTP